MLFSLASYSLNIFESMDTVSIHLHKNHGVENGQKGQKTKSIDLSNQNQIYESLFFVVALF